MFGEVPRDRTAKREWCPRCNYVTTFLYDHGDKMFICAECEL